MCKFFSFSVDRSGNVYAILGEDRQKALVQGQNPDSHSFISDFYGLDEDQTWKFEIPLDKGDIDILCQGRMPEKLQIEDVDTLRRWYDGGIPINEMPLDVAEATIKWICEHLEEIKEAGRLKFSSPLAEQIFASDGQEVIALSIARQRGQLALELAKYIVGQGWGWDEGQVATLIQGSKGWMREWREGEKLYRQRVRILNWPEDQTHYRIFVSRYRAPFISRKEMGPEVGEEDRIFIYPVYALRKEGETGR